MPAPTRTKAKLYKRYPSSSLLTYNGATILHFLLGGLGIIYGFGLTTVSISIGSLYLVFAFGEMYILMPFKVCPSCVYRRLEGGLCPSNCSKCFFSGSLTSKYGYCKIAELKCF